uniref:Transmembrane protein n=1 Tax=Globodera pallida TaxID=36090 RepID=A0A183BWC1_GLOPA
MAPSGVANGVAVSRSASFCNEASSENQDRRRPSLFSDIVQAQLALWTLVITVFYSYAWQQHRKKFLLSLFVVVPPVLLLICTLSSLLTAIVILGRLFSSPVRFHDILRVDDGALDESEGGSASGGAFASFGSGMGGARRRTASGSLSTSCQSCGGGSVGRSLSMSCEELPKPMCRKHSTNGSSLSLYGGNGLGSATAGGGAGLVARSESIGNGCQLQRHYQYAHFSSDGQ